MIVIRQNSLHVPISVKAILSFIYYKTGNFSRTSLNALVQRSSCKLGTHSNMTVLEEGRHCLYWFQSYTWVWWLAKHVVRNTFYIFSVKKAIFLNHPCLSLRTKCDRWSSYINHGACCLPAAARMQCIFGVLFFRRWNRCENGGGDLLLSIDWRKYSILLHHFVPDK